MAIERTSRQIACFRIASLAVFMLLWLTCRATQKNLLDDFWDRSGMEPNPNEGVVRRVDFEIDGDGQMGVLLANGQTMGSSGLAVWLVYIARSKGGFPFIGYLVSSC